jgi:hypothetical protein
MALIVSSNAARAIARAVDLLEHENMPSNTGLGASGAIQQVIFAVQSLWDLFHTAGANVGANKPSAEAINVRPAYWLLKVMNWVALNTVLGPSFPRVVLNGTFSLQPTPHTTWTLATAYLLGVDDPALATQIEVQMGWRHTGSVYVHWTHNFFVLTDGTAQNNTNVIVGPQTGERVMFRARFVNAAGVALSTYSYSGEVAIT